MHEHIIFAQNRPFTAFAGGGRFWNMTKLLSAIQTSHHSFTHASARGITKRIIIDQMAFSRVFVVNGGEEMQEGAYA